MSERIYTINLPTYSPYEWAKKEMRRLFPSPDKFRITELDRRVEKPGIHVAVFHGSDDQPTIWRVSWECGKKVKYSVCLNYHELKLLHPELVAQLERNGEWVFGQAMKKTQTHHYARAS